MNPQTEKPEPDTSHPNQPSGENSLRPLARLICVESLLTVVGGFMDAYAFMAHGHVFANAQTGNVVLFAVEAIAGSWTQAVRHLPPIAAFVLGVGSARLLGAKTQKKTFRATLLCQTIELAVLLFLSLWGSSLPNEAVVPVISFVAALQITSFDALGPFSFNSAMITGDLKTVVSASVMALLGSEPSRNKAKAVVGAIACVSFVAGALFGAFWTHRHPVHTLFPCVALVLLGLLLTWREHRIGRQSPIGS